MAAIKRRRWYSLSLRTLLIGMTLVSMWFWWFFHHRMGRVLEKERLQKQYGTPSGSVGSNRPAVELDFQDILFAWQLPRKQPRTPDAWWWLRPVTAPKLHGVDLYIDAARPLTEQSARLARSAACVRLRASHLPSGTLERLISNETRELYIYPSVPTKELAVIAQAEHLRVLCLKCPDDPLSRHDNCAWLQSCRELDTIYAECGDPAFLRQLGQQLGGVERLHLISADATILGGLAQWTRLRYLSIEYAQLNDRLLEPLEVVGPQLERLEIYHGDSRVLTPAGLTTLKNWSGLRSLKFGDCQLTAEHLAVLAELSQLQELALRTQHLTAADVEPLREMSQVRLVDLDEEK